MARLDRPKFAARLGAPDHCDTDPAHGAPVYRTPDEHPPRWLCARCAPVESLTAEEAQAELEADVDEHGVQAEPEPVGLLVGLRTTIDTYRDAVRSAPSSGLTVGQAEAQYSPAVVHAAAQLLEALDGALVLEPCHVTGMHDPSHTVAHVCEIQRGKMAKAVVAALGLDFDALPHRLHSPRCGWCHNVPSQEQYRDQLRQLHEWAGAEISPELAAPADDAPRPDDPFWVLCLLTDLSAPEPGRSVLQGTIVGAADKAHPTLGRGYRVARALQALEAEGLVRSHDSSTRGWSLAPPTCPMCGAFPGGCVQGCTATDPWGAPT